jgi:thiamine biosynthesis lipoprotein
MDTYVNVTIPKNKNSDNVFEQVHNEFIRLNKKYNVNDTNSLIYKINNRKTDVIRVDTETIKLFKTAEFYFKLTNNYFDVTTYTISRFWDFHTHNITKKNFNIVLQKTEQNFKFMGLDKIIINKDFIKFKNNKVKIDFGGIVKGYAVDNAVLIVKKYYKSGIVDAGGDLYVLGEKYNNKLWTVGIKNPILNKNDIIKIIEVSDKSVTTSGDYYRFVEFDNIRYCHIFNPNTGKNARYINSVTVISDNTMKSDILATAIIASEKNYLFILKKMLKFDNSLVFYIKTQDNNELKKIDKTILD